MDDIEEKSCPICDGPCVPMGALGNRLHFRCRNCGAECYRQKHPRLTPSGAHWGLCGFCAGSRSTRGPQTGI